MKRMYTKISSILIVLWMVFYLSIAWYISSYLPENIFLQLIYYIVASLLWIPLAVKIIAWANDNDN